MRFTTLLVLAASLFSFSACESAQRNAESSAVAPNSKSYEAGQLQLSANAPKQETLSAQPVSLNAVDTAHNVSQAIERKIIRNANLSIEVASPLETQRKLFSIAESHGGFVVTSEMTQQSSDDKSKPQLSVNLVVRVPANQFDQVVEEIRGAGTRILQEKRTGQDVTEEFIDLEARMKNQKALENQFLDIMKRAGKVEDALEVQRQLAEVRTEIEKLEGRKRFLENQASLSTINVTLQTPTQIVNPVGFWYNVKSAFADGVDVAGEIVLFVIRAVIALLSIIVLIVLPLALLAKLGIKIVRRRRKMQPVTVAE